MDDIASVNPKHRDDLPKQPRQPQTNVSIKTSSTFVNKKGPMATNANLDSVEFSQEALQLLEMMRRKKQKLEK
ncbi:MAG: hypothetical protein K0S74_1069 [Chlamydiales bacterium]|jgi:hypothetical protein|nr:hypothetical protein [Chlamydiales bacterium]